MARKDSEKPMELIQSYLVTSAKYDFNVYEKRILYRVVELIQSELKGQPIGEGIAVNSTLFGSKEIIMPVSRFLKDGEEDKNHCRIKKAFERLSQLQVKEDNEKRWAISQVVTNPKLEYGASVVRFTIDELIIEKLLDFAKGYNQYELGIAFNFRSQYSMRFYELISRCSRPAITYTIDSIREMFMLENRYNLSTDFFRYVIDPAQKELKESKSPYWFTYDKIKVGRAFKSIQFNVHYRPEYDKKILQQSSIRWEVECSFMKLLNQSLGTEDKTWKAHVKLLSKVQHIDYDELKKILRKAHDAKNPVGYVVNAFKKQLRGGVVNQE